MKATTLILVILSSLVGPVNCSLARTIDSCVSLEGMTDVSKLKQELDKGGIHYRTDSEVICVSQDHREEFYRVVRKLFPPDPSVSRSIRVPPSPTGIPLASSKLTDPLQHKMLKEEMERQKIWYTTDDNGALWYEITRQEQVSELIFKIIENDIPVDRSIHYAQPYSRDLFKTELDRSGVPYEAKTRRNKEWIIWKEADTPQVKKIMEFVKTQTIEHSKKQLENQRRNEAK